MKHTLKKFLTKFQATPELTSAFQNSIIIEDLKNIDLKEHMVFGLTEGDEVISMFTLYQGKEKYILPEPDLVVCLFETGRFNAIRLADLRKKLIADSHDTSKTMNNCYTFYATACLAVTSLVNCLEAFINRTIPNNFEFTSQEVKGKIVQNKDQIERNQTFEKKIKEIIPEALKKNFHIQNQSHYTTLSDLKTLRDDMTHLKSYHNSKALISYEELYNRAFKFDYMKALNAVKFYINFYATDLIQPCTCGSED